MGTGCEAKVDCLADRKLLGLAEQPRAAGQMVARVRVNHPHLVVQAGQPRGVGRGDELRSRFVVNGRNQCRRVNRRPGWLPPPGAAMVGRRRNVLAGNHEAAGLL